MADETESLCPSVQGQLPQQHCTSASRERPILWSMTDVHTSAAHAFRSSSVRRARRRRKEGRMGSRAVRLRRVLANAEHLTRAFTPARAPGWVQRPEACPPAARSRHHIFFQCFPLGPVSVFLPTDSYLQHCLAFAVLVRKGGWSSESTDGVGGCKRAKRMAFLNADLLSSRLEETPPSALGSIEQPERNNPHAARSLTPGKGP